MAILGASKLLLLFAFGSRPLLYASGHIGFAAKMTVVEALTNLGLSVLFVVGFGWGLAGVAAGTLFGRLLAQTFILPPYACKKAGINWWGYVRAVGGSGLTAGVLFAAVCYGVKQVLPCSSWMEFFIQIGIAAVCYVPIAFLVLVSSEDRRRVGGKLRTVLSGA
jgi:O-antigen/teichoic acid export membrane protein